MIILELPTKVNSSKYLGQDNYFRAETLHLRPKRLALMNYKCEDTVLCPNGTVSSLLLDSSILNIPLFYSPYIFMDLNEQFVENVKRLFVKPQGEEAVEEIPSSLLFGYQTKPHPAISGRNPSKVSIRWRPRKIHSEGVSARCDDMLHSVDVGNKIWVRPRKHLHS
ncbi:hypothetical protein ACTXT7_015612 [Hymenolepis weldensis]